MGYHIHKTDNHNMPTKVIRFKEGRYEGEVNSAGDPEGNGTLEYPGNDEFLRQYYEGDFVNKKAKGKYTYPNGDIYNGQWNDGVRQGKGTYKYKDDGGVYEGDWVNGIKQGSGVYTFGSGDVFTGTYDNNVRHGEGKLVKADGEERSENWEEGKLISFNITKEKKKTSDNTILHKLYKITHSSCEAGQFNDLFLAS